MKRSWAAGLFAGALLPAAMAIAQSAATPAPPGATGPAQPTTNAAPGNSASEACERALLTDFDPNKGDLFGHDVSIWSVGKSAVMFRSGMTIDADGAPNAYNPQNTGLDDLSNAGGPGHWDGLAADRDGNPIIQGPDDPFPGFYISQTALVDWSKGRNDPMRYVDASKVPYIVLPGVLSRRFGIRLGDFAVVMNARRGIVADAIFADIGTLGEGSIALANDLGIWSDAREGGTRGGVLYLIYAGSGDHQPHSADEIESETNKIFQQWGGMEKLDTCAAGLPSPPHFQRAERNFH
ncbi:MAG TPA: glycoside hydrolase family 75 protein [Candidatus Aquilonibacter sp.]|nr:glycoside hydrolase family 75 protein [Candidatus Aquilonibacter sp.]